MSCKHNKKNLANLLKLHRKQDSTFLGLSSTFVSMSGTAQQRLSAQANDPFEAALRAALSGVRDSGRCSQGDKALILALSARLTTICRARYAPDIKHVMAQHPARGTPTFDNVVGLLDRRRQPEWKSGELQAALAGEGLKLDAKALSNITNYLVKSGRFRRLARGHYMDATGLLFVTSDELPQGDIAKGSENED